MKTPFPSRYSYCLLFCLQAVSQAIEYPKKANADALNTANSWTVGVTTPGTSDVMLWNSLITIPNANTAVGTLPSMGANLSVAGIKVTDVGALPARNTAQRYTGFQSASASNTLTLGANGIDMSAAFQTFMIQARVVLDTNQTWTIANANTSSSGANLNQGEDLVVQGAAANIPFNFNGKTLTTAGAGQITLHSGLTIGSPLPAAPGTLIVGNDGFIIQGGGNQTTTVQDTLNVQVNGRFRLQNNSGAGGISLVSAAPITVNSGGTLELRCNSNAASFSQSGPIVLKAGSNMAHQMDSAAAPTYTTSGPITVEGNTTWRVTGSSIPTNGAVVSGALSGSGNISYQNTATGKTVAPAVIQDLGQVRLSGDNSLYTGTFTLNGGSNNRTLRLMTANSGSAAATWNVGTGNILEIDGVSVELGGLRGSGTATNSSATTLATLNVSRGTFGGVIQDGGTQLTAVNKIGTETATLTGFNSYTGGTTVSQGTLGITGDLFAPVLPKLPGPFTVADGATLSTSLGLLGGITATTGNITVGSTTGGTLQFDYGTSTNPAAALVSAATVRFNTGSNVKVVGKNLSVGTFPLLQYTTYDAGGTAVLALPLTLPPRTTGSLADNGANTINLTINSTQQVKWNGNVSNDWDIDPTGGGVVGTPNWLTTVTNASTRYIQGTPGADVVTFDDTASAGTEKVVNLTASLAPTGITFNNTAKNYTLTGTGKLTGNTGIEKNGTGMLTLANTTANDYSGGTFINAGTLRLGDGVTTGGGSITGAITNEAALVLNRPDSFDIAATLTGAGSLTQSGAGTTGITGAVTLNGPITLSAGKLKLSGGGTLPGDISGTGQLEAAGGTLAITGSNANSTGLTTVSAGMLTLNKPEGVNAIGGDLTFTGGGEVTLLANEQIPNTATLRVLGTSTDSLRGTFKETFSNAIIDGAATTQLILRANSEITGTATINQGILSTASGQTSTVNAITLNSPTADIRIAASTGASVLNVGAGGITASGGTIEVKFNNNPQDGTLNLGGDLTTTGNLAIVNGGFTGTGNLNVINVQGSRNFSIGAGTTTTVAADIAGTAADSLTKTGTGTLTLLSGSAVNILSTAGTTVSGGTLLLQSGSSVAGNLQVSATGTLSGAGSLSGTTTVAGTLSPTDTADSIAALTSTAPLTFGPNSVWAVDVGSWTGLTPGTDWDLLSVGTLGFTSTASNKLTLRISGTPTGFSEVAKTLAIGTSVSAVTGFDVNAIQVDASGFVGGGTWEVRKTGNTIELVYTPGFVNPYDAWADEFGLVGADRNSDADPDKDGQINRLEFALRGVPNSGSANTRVVSKIASVGGQMTQTLTFPVRNGVSFSGSPTKSGSADSITYNVQATDDFDGWDATVTEVFGADAADIQTGLPSLPSGWTYKTFRTPGPVSTEKREFIRVVVNPAA